MGPISRPSGRPARRPVVGWADAVHPAPAHHAPVAPPSPPWAWPWRPAPAAEPCADGEARPARRPDDEHTRHRATRHPPCAARGGAGRLRTTSCPWRPTAGSPAPPARRRSTARSPPRRCDLATAAAAHGRPDRGHRPDRRSRWSAATGPVDLGEAQGSDPLSTTARRPARRRAAAARTSAPSTPVIRPGCRPHRGAGRRRRAGVAVSSSRRRCRRRRSWSAARSPRHR